MCIMPQLNGSRTGHGTLVLTGILLVILVGSAALALRAGTVAGKPAASAVAPAPAIDPRLVLHPRTVAIAAVLTNGVRLTGTLAPDLPGKNTFDVALQGSLARSGSPLRLEVTMFGMRMAPIQGTLANHAGHYRGAMILPMFGAYRVAIEAPASAEAMTGVLTVTIPLPNL
jgi:hypothetical protein